MDSIYQRNIAEATIRIAKPFSLALFAGALLSVAVGVGPPELVWLPVDGVSELSVEESTAVEADADEDTESLVVVEVELVETAEAEANVDEDKEPSVAVEVALVERVEEAVRVMPQAASASNVKGIFLASHSKVCRWIESRQYQRCWMS